MGDLQDVFYIVLRGSRQQPLFSDDADRQRLLSVVADVAEQGSITAHAYCWLPNEARIALGLPASAVNEFAREIAKRYLPRAPDDISLSGAPLGQSFRGVPVDSLEDLPELVRHIHLAPLRAKLTDDLRNYAWSSHLAYLGAVSVAWLTTSTTCKLLADSSRGTLTTYDEFMAQGIANAELQFGLDVDVSARGAL